MRPVTTQIGAPSVPIYLAGEFVEAGSPLEVRNPATGELVATTWQAGPDELERATAAAVSAFDQTRRLASFERRDALQHVADAIARDADELAELLTRESGKPIRDARGEVSRGALTFRTAAEEALRINGEWLPLDWTAANRGRSGIVRRYPIGPVAGISPFNFPLNLAAHKVAPAIAAGCSIVLKPPSKDPLVMLRVAQYLSETSLPKGAVSILPMDRPTGDRMVADDRFKLLSFTGSPTVGWKMKTDAGRKKVILELGGNAGAIVDETADLDWAVARLVYGAFAYAGQVCISVQRIYVVDAIYDEFERRFVDKVRQVVMGDPLDPATEVGPLIHPDHFARVEDYIRIGQVEGARLLAGGHRVGTAGNYFAPTLFAGDNDMRIAQEEIFGPVLSVIKYDSLDEAIKQANDTIYGLAAGVWSGDVERAVKVATRIRAGTVWINDFHLISAEAPFGGYKQSGIGRELGTWGLEEYTEVKHIHVSLSPDRKTRFWFDILLPRGEEN